MENKKQELAPKKKGLKKFKNLQIVIILIALCAIFSIAAPTFLSPKNLISVLRQISISCIIAMGMTVMIIAGGIDLSVGSVAALAGVVTATFAQQGSGLPLVISILLGLLVGTMAGFINGVLVAKGGLPPFIATLGMTTAARGLAFIIAGGTPIYNIDERVLFLGSGSFLGVPMPIIILAICVVITFIITRKLKFGRYIYALGDNETAARVSGINISKNKIMIYAFGGLMAAIAGLVLAARIKTGNPASAEGYELDAIAACVIGGASLSGGVGSVSGTVIGALIIGVINNGLDILGVSSYYQSIVKGAIIVGAVLLDLHKNQSFSFKFLKKQTVATKEQPKIES